MAAILFNVVGLHHVSAKVIISIIKQAHEATPMSASDIWSVANPGVMWNGVRVFFLQAYSTTGTERLTAKLFLCNLMRSISCSVSASR
jgi:hypothetical protein